MTEKSSEQNTLIKKGKKKKHIASVANIFSYIFLTVFAILIILPFLFALSTSFTTRNGIYDLPFKWIPQPFTFDNYSEVFRRNFPVIKLFFI